MSEVDWFVLKLNPEPWRVGPIGVRRTAGKIQPYVGQDQQLAAYQAAVREAIGEHKMRDGKIKITFYLWRNRAAYTTPAQQQHRKHDADATNMQKALEDALQGVLMENDKDVVDVRTVVVEQGPDVSECIAIEVRSVFEDDVLTRHIPPDVWETITHLRATPPVDSFSIAEEWHG